MPSVPLPSNIRRSLTCRLKKSWSLDDKRQLFIGPKGAEFQGSERLPPNSTVTASVPNLGQQPKAKLSAAEKELARYIQIILPENVEPKKVLDEVAQWPCFESVMASPQAELPSGFGNP